MKTSEEIIDSQAARKNPRFVLNIGSIREIYPDMPEQAGSEIMLWDRQEKAPVATFHAGYAQAICLEITDGPGSMPFTAMEEWFNSLDNEALESEGLPATKEEFFS